MDQPASLATSPTLTPRRPLQEEGSDTDLIALVERAKAGDREAFTVLYHRYLAEVYRYAVLRLETREAAEDATQTIFVRALAALPTCRENAAFVGWLFAIARSVVADHLRARRRYTNPLTVETPWLTAGPEEVVLQSEAMRVLRIAREHCLTARERELFDLLLTEMNDKQIALVLGRSHGAVRTAHWRLLGKLRACLGPFAGGTKGAGYV